MIQGVGGLLGRCGIDVNANGSKGPVNSIASAGLIFALLVIPMVVGLQEPATNNGTADNLLLRLGTVSDPRISESSGLCRCGAIDGAFWTLNDSGCAAELYLISSSGRTLATCVIDGAQNVDWEAMSSIQVDGQTFLMIGDVGDNTLRRESFQVYVVAEPELSDDSKAAAADDSIEFAGEAIHTPAVRLEFAYDDEPHNCEAIAYDARQRKIWLIEKVYVDDRRESQPGIFALDLPLNQVFAQLAEMQEVDSEHSAELVRTNSPILLNPPVRIHEFPVRNVTGMDFSPDGNRLLIRTYMACYLYAQESAAGDESASWQSIVQSTRPIRLNLPIQMQGEAICFSPDSRSAIVTSEREGRPLWRVGIDAQVELLEPGSEEASGSGDK